MREFKVADIAAADFGRAQIELAQSEMPGLMACRAGGWWGAGGRPLEGARVAGCIHLTEQTAVLVDTLAALGADVRWCSSNVFSTHDAAAAAVARDTASVFAWSGESLEEYWWCIERALTWPDGGGPDLLLDDGGDATLLIHEGARAERLYAETGKLPNPAATKNPEFKVLLARLRESIEQQLAAANAAPAAAAAGPAGPAAAEAPAEPPAAAAAAAAAAPMANGGEGFVPSKGPPNPPATQQAQPQPQPQQQRQQQGQHKRGREAGGDREGPGGGALPNKWITMAQRLLAVTEESAVGCKRLYEMQAKGRLLFPAFNINDGVTKSKFDNMYGCQHSVLDGIRRATDVMISGKLVFVAGYGDVGKGVAHAFQRATAEVVVSEVDPICALQARMAGLRVGPLEDVVATADIFVTCTGCRDVIRLEHLQRMKNNAIVANMGHYPEGEIDMKGLAAVPGLKRVTIKPQVDRFVFPDGHGVIVLVEGRLLNLGCTTGHPSYVMSAIFTTQVVAQVELWRSRGANKYRTKVYLLPRQLDEQVARLHLPKRGRELTRLTEQQSAYINVPIGGPYKAARYRY